MTDQPEATPPSSETIDAMQKKLWESRWIHPGEPKGPPTPDITVERLPTMSDGITHLVAKDRAMAIRAELRLPTSEVTEEDAKWLEARARRMVLPQPNLKLIG